MPQVIRRLALGERVVVKWECGGNRQVKKGDRVFFLRGGRHPKGLFGSGTVTRPPRSEVNKSLPGGQSGQAIAVIDVAIESLVGASAVLVPLSDLQRDFPAFNWSLYQSARPVLPQAVITSLEARLASTLPAEASALERAAPAVEAVNRKQLKVMPVESDPLRTMLISIYFAIVRRVTAGKEVDIDKALQPLQALLHREPDFDARNGLCQMAGLALQNGHAVLDRFEPLEPTDALLAAAFETFPQRFPDVMAKLSDSLSRVAASRWPYVEDYRLYWIPPPHAGWRPRHADDLRQVENHLSGVAESCHDEWMQSCREFAFEYEKARLWQSGLRERVPEVRITDDANAGHDIASFEADGNPRPIAVKATRYGRRQPFTLSGAEIEAAHRSPSSYYVYRLFDALVSPKFYFLRTRGHSSGGIPNGGSQENGMLELDWQRVNFRAPWLQLSNLRRGEHTLRYEYLV